MWKIGVIKRADKIGDNADPWPTPISAEKKDELKPFYE